MTAERLRASDTATDTNDVLTHVASNGTRGVRRGCALNRGYLQLSLLALAVIPELRISDLGLVDVSRFTGIPVIE